MSEVKVKPSTVAVLCCDDYDAFNMIKGNRTLDLNKIKKILADIEAGTNLLQYFPVLVTKNNEGKFDIIDGQHRFMVAKKIKAPVHFILAENLTLYQIARLNSNTEKWKAADFINCYVQLGNENYIKLQEFMARYKGIPPTTALNLLAAMNSLNGSNSTVTDAFHKGEFVIKYATEAEQICSTASKFKFAHNLSRTFLTAVLKIIGSAVYPVDELVAKVNADPEALRQHDHWRKYLTNLEEIANKGKSKRVAIY